MALPAMAALHTEKVNYKDGKTPLVGYLAYDDAAQGKRPAVIVVHEWMGLNSSAKKHAEDVAGMGYVAFAVDIYGNGQTTEDPKVAADWSGKYKADRKLYRDRMTAGLNALKKQSMVDPNKIAAIGYCFGGTGALELARTGAPLVGAVCFHGSLNTPNPDDAKNIKGRILVLNGGDDGYVPANEIQAFQDEMRKAGVDWMFVNFGNAVHGFTNPGAGTDNSKGYAYNEKADKRSWMALKGFFIDVFK